MLLLGETAPEGDGDGGGSGNDGRETVRPPAASASSATMGHKRGISAPAIGAGSGTGTDFTFGSGNHGASASRAGHKLTKSESSGSSVLGGGKSKKQKKKKWSHGFEPGDHVVRWSHIALYPIQIHGIVLQVSEDDDDDGGPGSVMLCDFGLTKYGGDNDEDGGDESSAAGEGETEAASSTGSVSSSSAAAAAPTPSASPVPPTGHGHGQHHLGFKSLTSSSTHRRLNVITLTTRRDMKKWRKVNYGGDGLFSSSSEEDGGGGGKKSKWTAWLPVTSPKPSSGSKSITADGDEATEGSSERNEIPQNVEFPIRVGEIDRDARDAHPEFLWILSSLEEELVPRDVTPATAPVATTTRGGGTPGNDDASELLRPFHHSDDDDCGGAGQKKGGGELLRGFPPPPPLTAAVPPPPPAAVAEATSSPSWGWRSSPAILNNGGGGGGGSNNKHGKGAVRKKQRMGGFFGHGHGHKKKRTSKRRLERESLFPIVVGEDLPEFLAILSVGDGDDDSENLSSSTEKTAALHDATDEGEEEKIDGGGLGYEPYRPSRFERTPSGHIRQIPPSPQSSKTGTAGGKPKLPKTDPAKLVLSRVRFLLEHEGEDGRSDVLPPYHVFHSNSECIAVWCKTGRWSTLQAAVFLHSTAVGNAKQMFLAVGGVAALNPLLIPAIAPLGIAYVGAPWLYLNKCKGHWERATTSLTDRYWAWAVKDPDVFVEVIHQWSGLR